METNQVIIERSIYANLLRAAIEAGVTIDPDEYLPVTLENQKRYQEDIKKIENFVAIFGVGNNQARGQKLLPRITVDLTSYYPGDVGVEQYMVGSLEENKQYALYEYPFETKNSTYDIHLVAQNSNQMRLLHQIMYTALPTKGYIKPFTYATIKEYLEHPGLLPTGNLFLQVGNYYDHNDTDHGILEKVYTYNVVDCLLEEIIKDANISPITDISAFIIPEGTNGIHLEIRK